MTKLKQRPRRDVTQPTPYEEARDEMFQHIMQCGVIGSHPDDQKEWFDNTIQYMTSRYPELNTVQVKDLRTLGERFAQPPRVKIVEAVIEEVVIEEAVVEEAGVEVGAIEEAVTA